MDVDYERVQLVGDPIVGGLKDTTVISESSEIRTGERTTSPSR